MEVAPRNGGAACAATDEELQCNPQACNKDCRLSEWTFWTGCSKECDIGTKKRIRIIREPVEGTGDCADKWDKQRLEYKECNTLQCIPETPGEAIQCDKKRDIILLLDTCPKHGQEAFEQMKRAAASLVGSFEPSGRSRFSLISYCGPRTWTGVSKCTGENFEMSQMTEAEAEDFMEGTCRNKVEVHLRPGLPTPVRSALDTINYGPGTKLLNNALASALTEMTIGRKNAATFVVVFMDGQPLSFRKTKIASHMIRKSTRLTFVVVSEFAPLKDVKEWVSRRWEENLVKVTNYTQFAVPEQVTHIVADMCGDNFVPSFNPPGGWWAKFQAHANRIRSR